MTYDEFAMKRIGGPLVRCAGQPGQHIIGAGVCRERVGLHDFGPDRHVLAVDLDGPRLRQGRGPGRRR